MAYNVFSLAQVKRTFGLQLHEQTNVFGAIAPLPISELLQTILAENIPLALAIHTEKARSELIIMPILVELRRLMNREISLFSGIEFNVDPLQGLNGVCDFVVAGSPEQLILTAPLLMLVEAKNDNIKAGLGQCMAEMIAAQLFNERENIPISTLYGVVTTGSIWKFLTLEGTIMTVDQPEYYLEQIDTIMGILASIVRPHISHQQ